MAQAMAIGTPRRGRTEKAALEVKKRALAAKLFLFFLSLFFWEQCQQLIFFFKFILILHSSQQDFYCDVQRPKHP